MPPDCYVEPAWSGVTPAETSVRVPLSPLHSTVHTATPSNIGTSFPGGNAKFGWIPAFLAGRTFGQTHVLRVTLLEFKKAKLTHGPTCFNVEVFSHPMERSMPPFAACKLLSPPYLAVTPWRHQPPLGSILLWHLSTHPPDLLMLREAHASAPWCSLVITLPESNTGIDLDALYDGLSQLACLPVALRPGMSPLSAIRNRRPPTAAEVIRYIQARPGYERLASQLRLLVAERTTERSRRSVREHLKRSHHLGPRH